MKNFFFFIFTFLNVILIFGQDKIFTHKNEIINCKILEIDDNNIKFNYQNESLTNTISRNVVNEIQFASGRTQKISDKIIVDGEKDWEKVQITNLESDIKGLTKIGDFTAKSSTGWGGMVGPSKSKMLSKAIDKIKKEAAKKGAHIILILDTTSDGSNTLRGASGSVTGIGYTY